MNYWLIKSDPETFSWDKLLKEGTAVWDGVRNYQARNNLKNMKKDDIAFFYHSTFGKEITGTVKIIKEAYQDPTTSDTQWVAVSIVPHKTFKKTVTIEHIKTNKLLQYMPLIRQSRLSVMPVSKKEFDTIILLSDSK